MQVDTFFDAVDAHAELNGIGIDVEQGILTVEHLPSKLVTCLPADAISKEDVNWDILRAILVGEREPAVLYHMTRVVGYYSRVDNYNKSKLGELKDRVRGNYATDGAPRDVEAATAIVDSITNG